MRLHHLRVEAFGPFAGAERVDFDDLAGNGLFLLCGPTGAGKTSVLDAVCFALFGQVPGDRDKAKRLHSDHAPRERGPRVVLEVTLRGRRLRITRSPEWMRPKKRGTGRVREHAKVLVEEMADGRWQQRTSRVDEAGDLLGPLLGLTLAQFCQVALLPQGRFETFLRCGAQERHTLLEKIFGTQRFRAVEDWLADHRRALAGHADEHARRVAGILERVGEAGGGARPDDLDPETVREWSDSTRARTWSLLAEAAQRRGEADRHAKDARSALDAARDLADRQARHHDALRRDADLRALDDGTQRMTRQVEQARRAATVRPLLEIRDTAAARLTAAGEALEAARTTVDAIASPAVAGVPADTAAAEAAVRHHHDETTRLETLLPVQRQVSELTDALGAVDGELGGVDEQRHLVESRRRETVERQQVAREAHAEAAAAAARVEALRVRADRAHEVAQAADRLPAALQRRDRLTQQVADASAAALSAREAWLDLRQTRLDGMAAELAHDLRDEHPCPVCGSAAHPAPAAPSAQTVSADDEHRAQQAWQRAERVRQEHADALARSEQELAGLRAGTDGSADPTTARRRLARARHELTEVAARAERADALHAEVADLQRRAEQQRDRAHVLDAHRERLLERQAQLARQRTELQRRLDTAVGERLTLTRRLDDSRHAARRCETLLDALRRHDDADQALRQAETRLRRAATEAGFDEVDAVRQAMLSPADLGNTETLLRRRADEAARVRAVLDDPQLAEAAAEPPADLAPLTEAVQRAERRRDEAVAAERGLDQRARRLDTLHEELVSALAAERPVRDSLGVAERLATLCAGTSADNRYKMRLSAYVLAARLEQVVAAANGRLLRMSSGRYSLQHTVERGVGDRRGGLGLQVHDGWTGDLRDPATLSGGETFFTSLALALGLADVVTHEAGGAEIGTLFVDEGFGSLDPDTLDEVMDVLDQLRSGGRSVGIVSHVGDLRARVPAQVHVRKARAGSTLTPAAAVAGAA